MLNLASQYGLKYTGVMIENYEDKTDGEITKQMCIRDSLAVSVQCSSPSRK